MTITDRLRRWYATQQVKRLPHEVPEVCYCGGRLAVEGKIWVDARTMYLPGSPFLCCQKCGVFTTEQRLTASSVDHLYRSGLYRRAMTGKSGVDLEHLLKEKRRAFDLIVWGKRPVDGLIVADIGCGLGGGLLAGRLLGARSDWGVEPDPDCRNIALGLGLCTVSELYRPLMADVIMMSHVLEHAHNPLGLLAKVGEHLRPDGTILIETPELKPDMVPSEWHPWYFTQDSLRKLIELAGLHVVVMEPGIRAIARQG